MFSSTTTIDTSEAVEALYLAAAAGKEPTRFGTAKKLESGTVEVRTENNVVVDITRLSPEVDAPKWTITTCDDVNIIKTITSYENELIYAIEECLGREVSRMQINR